MAANETARELGWIKSYDELHKAAKRARVELPSGPFMVTRRESKPV